jgi:serine/threonine protein kinase/formylglycine-generating enzyme required for sulfatase activity
MSDRDFILADDSFVKLYRHVDAVCSQFERQWREQRSPRIEDFLAEIPDPGRDLGLCELIAMEVDLRRAAEDDVRIDSYLARFPDDNFVVREAFASLDGLANSERPAAASTVEAAPGKPCPQAEPEAAALSDNEPVPGRLGRFPILKQLGMGSYGIVYLATDTHVGQREVALKVPRPERFQNEQQRRQFVLDAELAALLKHPGIVTIYGIETDGDRVLIIQEYLSGGDLRQRLKAGPIKYEQAVAWLIPVAEAVAFAHQKNVFHRDLKPANILLDERNQPRVADFGLALHESEQQHRREYAGTLPYMSPEQVRCETNRLDGRSDTWSLGIIFYELLTGRRPFRGSKEEIADQIKYRDPRPPRELKPDLPPELERICLKCLAKPVAQRYTTATDLGRDLRNWQADPKPAKQGPIRIVPKGLRSFDACDADFFLDLLPGPRDRNGLPECIRFWKARIEESDPAQNFAVGVLHGPSGCGKSSLVQAGLLPRLAPHVRPVFVEATATDTEVRLLRGVRRQLPEVPRQLSLADLLSGIRDGRWNPERRKILIVLDQFEQWLHAGNLLGPAQLVDALRHCDGEHLQCLVLVREDFWTGISRFMDRLEIPLQEQRNAALVDRFDQLHARRVLTDFGRAFGRLPDDPRQLTREQHEFLDAAIDQLSEEGRVICVRLALFGDLIKGKPWTKAALMQSGGAAGLGMTFLEDTFAAKSAPAAHKRHKDAVARLFARLLPEPDTDIKGSMQTREALLESCGYSKKPQAFDELIRILDDELRLITPTDPEGSDLPGAPSGTAAGVPPRYYQFTHDYLVPSVRRWLNFQEAATASGRSRRRLAERARLWSVTHENRQLPSFWEFLNIRLFVPAKNWSDSQRRMMRQAARVHVRRWGIGAAALVLVGSAIFTIVNFELDRMAQFEVEAAVNRVEDRPAAEVQAIIGKLKENPRQDLVLKTLQRRYPGATENRKLRLAFARADFGHVEAAFLVSQINTVPADEVDNLATAFGHARHDSLRAVQDAASAAHAESDERREARLAIVELHLGAATIATSMCQIEDRPDPTRRTTFIDEFARWHGSIARATELSRYGRGSGDNALRSGLCLGIAEIPRDHVRAEETAAWMPILADWYRNMPDSVTHSAAWCVLHRWGAPVPEIHPAEPNLAREWKTNTLGMTMLKIRPGQFVRRDYLDDLPDPEAKDQTVHLTRDFFVSDREVSVYQLQQFFDDPDPVYEKPKGWSGVDATVSPTENHPAQRISWDDIILFCNWLSRKERLDPCYVRTGATEGASDGDREFDGWRRIPGATGYRLPTEAEWEYACRAGTTTVYACGTPVAVLSDYAVYQSDQAHECGSKLPNGWGLFDMHGNVREWCQDWDQAYGADGTVIDPIGAPTKDVRVRITRGGHWSGLPIPCQSSSRHRAFPSTRSNAIGFRVAAFLNGE